MRRLQKSWSFAHSKSAASLCTTKTRCWCASINAISNAKKLMRVPTASLIMKVRERRKVVRSKISYSEGQVICTWRRTLTEKVRAKTELILTQTMTHTTSRCHSKEVTSCVKKSLSSLNSSQTKSSTMIPISKSSRMQRNLSLREKTWTLCKSHWSLWQQRWNL